MTKLCVCWYRQLSDCCFVLFFFLGSDLYSCLFYFKPTFISFLFVWVCSTLPRFRYDKFMYLAWRRFLPLSLNYLLFFVGVDGDNAHFKYCGFFFCLWHWKLGKCV